MGWALTLLGGGYAQIDGVMYTVYVVVTDELTEAERDGICDFSAIVRLRLARARSGSSNG